VQIREIRVLFFCSDLFDCSFFVFSVWIQICVHPRPSVVKKRELFDVFDSPCRFFDYPNRAAKCHAVDMDKIGAERAFEDSPTETAPRSHRGAILWLLCLPVAYFLSTGPAAWLEIKVPATKSAVDAIYGPLGSLCDVCPPLGTALVFYVVVIWRVPLI